MKRLLTTFLLLSLASSSLAQESIGETIAGNKVLSALAAAVKAAGLADTLNDTEPFTILAPSDQAFKAAGALPKDKTKLKAILDLHIVKGSMNLGAAMVAQQVDSIGGVEHKVGLDGGRIKIGAANIVEANIECRNGYIHIIDSVYLPSAKGILDIAKGSKDLNMLVTALEATGLDKELAKDGPFTVFAPSDKAFAAAAGDLLKPENKEKLIEILKHHVVPGKVQLADLLTSKEYTSLAGAPIAGGLETGSISVGGMAVIKPDIAAENGVIHIIDGVLIPKQKTPAHFAVDLIEKSIKIGGGLYNGRNPEGCADVYELAFLALARLNPEALPESVQETLAEAEAKASKEKDATARAWALREGLNQSRSLLKSSLK